LLDIDGALLFVDFKNAFDTVEWNMMFNVLTKFGFKSNFINMVKTLYNDICSSVMNNGWQSKFFKRQRGIWQGCPLSSLLFILIAEILATKLRSCNQYEGIMIKCNQHVRNIKITQLADDTTIFLKNTNEIPVVINIIDEFGLISGLKLNKQKTEGILLGKSKHENECVIHDIKFSAVVKALGTYVGINSAKCEELNLNDKIVPCQKVINSWNNRNLTFYGRVTVI